MRMIAAIPVFQVQDVDRSVEFYTGVFDFVLTYGEGGFAVVKRDDAELHLTGATDESWRERGGASPVVSGAESFLAGTDSCRIQVEGVDALYERVRDSGCVHPNAPLEGSVVGSPEFGILDPDGNLITFFEPRPAGPGPSEADPS